MATSKGLNITSSGGRNTGQVKVGGNSGDHMSVKSANSRDTGGAKSTPPAGGTSSISSAPKTPNADTGTAKPGAGNGNDPFLYHVGDMPFFTP